MSWIKDPTMGDIELKLTHNDRNKGGHEAQVLEALRIFSFSHFTKGTAFLTKCPQTHNFIKEEEK